MTSLRICLIDDEESFVTTLAERLELRGHQATVALSGEEGLRCIAEHTPQVVILDLRMPGISGMETLRRIRATWPDLPVVMLSGHGAEADIASCLRLGAQAYLKKPTDISQLLATIHEVLDPSGGR